MMMHHHDGKESWYLYRKICQNRFYHHELFN
jgi:hypothetical protein